MNILSFFTNNIIKQKKGYKNMRKLEDDYGDDNTPEIDLPDPHDAPQKHGGVVDPIGEKL